MVAAGIGPVILIDVAVADPVGSLDRPRTTHKFGSKFYYYS